MTEVSRRAVNFYRAAACAVVRCLYVSPSVRLDVCHVHVFCRNDSPSGSYSILVFHTKRYGNYSDGDALTGAKIALFDHYLAL